MRRRGLALVLVVGVLGVLAVLGSAFAVLSRLERKSARQRVHATKAWLLARSGIEDALARLESGQDPDYGGENWDGSPDGLLSGFEASQESYRPTGTGTPADLEGCPARAALRPSFFARLGGGNPDTLGVDGRERGYTGLLGGRRNAYAVRLLPEEGIYVNGGAPADPPMSGYNAVLRRVLGNLAEELGLPRAQGEALVDQRPAGGWFSLDAAPEAMRPYLALRAWVDKKVIRPNVDPAWNPPVGAGALTPNSWTEIRTGRQDAPAVGFAWGSPRRSFNARTNSYAPDFERDLAGRIVGRAPVCLNWARSRPAVIKALLRGLSGVYVDEVMVNNGPGGFPSADAQDWTNLGTLCAQVLATSEVDALVSVLQDHAGFPTWASDYPEWDRTAAFDTWDEFERFLELKCYASNPSAWRDPAILGRPNWGRSKLDLVRAGFNPNSALNKLNPGESRFKRIDKSDLKVYSTELSLEPSPYKAVSSCGRVLDAQGRLLAERTLGASVLYSRFRMTTQSELCAGDLGTLDVAGDEVGFRLPGASGFLEEGASLERTWGSRFSATGRGFALQTYPEPQWPGSPCPLPAVYDGSLQLATIETEADPAAVGGLTFLASFDDGLDADYAAGGSACSLHLGHGVATDSLMGKGPAGAVAQSNPVYPDGCYCESKRVPGYPSRGNVGDGLQGLVSFWCKPIHDQNVADVWHGATHLVLSGSGSLPLPGPLQTLQVGIHRLQGPYWGIISENQRSSIDAQIECGTRFGFAAGNPAPLPASTYWHARRWHLVTAQWNLLASTASVFSHYVLNATPKNRYYANYTAASTMNYGGNPANCVLTRDSYRADGTFGEPLFYLGSRGCMGGPYFSANATIDELAFITRSTNMTEAETLALSRFQAGRYSKADTALDPSKPEWLSCPIPLGPGARVLKVDRTLNLPRMAVPPPGAPPELWPDPARAFYDGQIADAVVRVLEDPKGSFRLGVDLRPRMGDNQSPWDLFSAPLLESPVLDDLTVTYTSRGGARVVAWGE